MLAAASAATRYGNVAMERLINDILKLGGRRENLELKLVGGGLMKIVNTTVPMALTKLGYTPEQVKGLCSALRKYLAGVEKAPPPGAAP